MHSANVEEVYAEDYELRRKMREPLRKQLVEDRRHVLSEVTNARRRTSMGRKSRVPL